MSDTKESMPAQPKTQELPAMTDRALLEDLSRVVRDGFAEMRGNITLLVEEGKATNTRLGILEHRVSTIEEARRIDSMPAKVGKVSENDAKQDAAIAQIITDVDGVKKDVARVEDKLDANSATTEAIKKSVSGFLKEHPSIVASIVTLITTAIGTATFWLASHGGH